MGKKRLQTLSFIVGLTFLLPTFALVAGASPSGLPAAPAPAAKAAPAAPPAPAAPFIAEPEPSIPEPVVDSSSLPPIEAPTAADALSQFIDLSMPTRTPDPEEMPSTGFNPRPMALDTDNNSINDARQLNGVSQWTGESVDGAVVGGGQRRDIDWWYWPMGNVSAGGADVMEFDIEKQNSDLLYVEVRVYPNFDYTNFVQANNYQTVYWDFMNTSQNFGTPTHVKVTAFETNLYFLYIRSYPRNGCCVVNYTIKNINDWTTSSDSSIDDNSNRTTADVFNPAAMPSNQQVEQDSDLVDVWDLTAQFSIVPINGDSARVNLNLTVDDGRTGTSDFYNTSQMPAVSSDLSLISVTVLLLYYQDASGAWRSYNGAGIKGDTIRISGTINGTPIYAAVYTYGILGTIGGQPILSGVPSWNAYNFTGFWRVEDRAPTFAGTIPDVAMWEDDNPSGQDLIDLAPYFTDDWDNGQMRFGIKYNQQPAVISMTITGSMLSVSLLQANYWGNVTVQMLGYDRGFDRSPSTADDHATSSNFFRINVRPVNDAPNITAIGLKTNNHADLEFKMAQGTTLVLTPTVSDLDGVSAFTFTTDVLPPFATFSAQNGTLVFTPGNADVGLHPLVENVSDGTASDFVQLLINVSNVNDDPSFIRVGGIDLADFPHTFGAKQGEVFSVVLEVDDADWTIGVQDDIRFASDKTFVTVARDLLDYRKATATFTPTNAQVGVMTILFSVGDNAGAFDDNINVSLVIANANDAPFWVRLSTVSAEYPLAGVTQLDLIGFDGATQARDFAITMRADDIDVSNSLGDALSFSTSQPSKFTVQPNADGVTAVLTVRPNQTDASRGYIEFDVIVTDQGTPGLAASVRVHLAVANINDPPLWNSVFAVNLTEGEPFSQIFSAVDPDGDPLSYGSDSQFFIPDPATGVVDFTPTNEFIEGADKDFDVTFTARDNHNAIGTMVVHVFIRNVNVAPSNVRINSPLESAEFGPSEGISLRGAAEDFDAADTGRLTYTWYVDGRPAGTGSTLLVTVPNPDTAPKTVQIRLMVEDTGDLTTNATVNVTIRGTAVAPPQPGFDAAFALTGLVLVAVAAVAVRRRRQA